ncbi:putative ATP-dependent RNA helicase DHX33, partial [Trichechus manatus latirostris]|uniref:RNA helicase n=1 Tax=Trichechus manatus latirostris TaxID=127582 RepID=A0A2Y9QJM5_TRIMA
PLCSSGLSFYQLLSNPTVYLFVGSSFFSGHPGVSHRPGGDRSDEQDLPRHCKAPPRRLPCDAGPSSVRLLALCTAAPRLPGGPQDSGLEVLAVQRVSKTQAWQRTGRAGREDSGICYRLYTEEEFEKFDKMTVPEIQRCNLASVMLQLLAMKVPDVLTFDFMSKPSPEFHCTEEILTIVSLLSVDSVLYNPPARRDEVQGIRKKFISSEGDHITLLNIYRTFKNIGGNK